MTAHSRFPPVKELTSSKIRRFQWTGIQMQLSGRAGGTINVFDTTMKRSQKKWAASIQDTLFYPRKYMCSGTVHIHLQVGSRCISVLVRVCILLTFWSYFHRTFPLALDIGCGKSHIAEHLYKEVVEQLFLIGISEKSLRNTRESEIPTHCVMADEEFLPFKENTFDLVVFQSVSLCSHSNPFPLPKINQVLKPDVVFMGAMVGAETLYKLRCSLQLAELEREGGFSYMAVTDLGILLGQAGRQDIDEIQVHYPGILEVMSDLCMGCENGSVPATFEILYMIGWKPHDSHAKPAKRGSANVSFGDPSKVHNEIKVQGKFQSR
uniref:Arginine-hydroxylase NDUFAF5, mitochondrial n=1 Tax=Oncorhynchus mykiss TaxID=8022 RepID=A0A8K9V8I1_ONCMY